MMPGYWMYIKDCNLVGVQQLWGKAFLKSTNYYCLTFGNRNVGEAIAWISESLLGV